MNMQGAENSYGRKVIFILRNRERIPSPGSRAHYQGCWRERPYISRELLRKYVKGVGSK